MAKMTSEEEFIDQEFERIHGKIESKKRSAADVFDALITQTRQRGGSPSVREISDAALAVARLVAAYTEVRQHAVQAGMPSSLARAIENADAALAEVQGRGD